MSTKRASVETDLGWGATTLERARKQGHDVKWTPKRMGDSLSQVCLITLSSLTSESQTDILTIDNRVSSVRRYDSFGESLILITDANKVLEYRRSQATSEHPKSLAMIVSSLEEPGFSCPVGFESARACIGEAISEASVIGVTYDLPINSGPSRLNLQTGEEVMFSSTRVSFHYRDPNAIIMDTWVSYTGNDKHFGHVGMSDTAKRFDNLPYTFDGATYDIPAEANNPEDLFAVSASHLDAKPIIVWVQRAITQQNMFAISNFLRGEERFWRFTKQPFAPRLEIEGELKWRTGVANTEIQGVHTKIFLGN